MPAEKIPDRADDGTSSVESEHDPHPEGQTLSSEGDSSEGGLSPITPGDVAEVLQDPAKNHGAGLDGDGPSKADEESGAVD